MAYEHEGISAFNGEQREEDRRSSNKKKRFSKTSNIRVISIVKETEQMQIDHCPLAKDTH